MSYRERLRLSGPTLGEVIGAMTRCERLLFWLSMGNLAACAAVAFLLGGNALNGMVRDGHYYLMMGNVYTQVSRPIFIYSVIHTVSIIITQPTAIVILFIARSRAKNQS